MPGAPGITATTGATGTSDPPPGPTGPTGPTGSTGPAAFREIADQAQGQIVGDNPLTRSVPVRLRYDPGTDPATVRFGFPDDVEWAFPRTLLETGLRTPARGGDVEVWPCGRVQTVVEFHTADGVEVVQFDTTALTRFLRHTYAAGAPFPAH
ncbi:SsgA family sporulation/cell division regulator [Streptomyces sp. NPDC046203]|uniref:SsgA family sporulation/cell division regulator n=1 Tax=Streptomyces sp. NPDC046203 TaxID=3154602 RepID=UPI00340E8700